jgi:serine/threonine protein kinase
VSDEALIESNDTWSSQAIYVSDEALIESNDTWSSQGIYVPEEDARLLFQQLIVAVDYCHRIGVINRDIKVLTRQWHLPLNWLAIHSYSAVMLCQKLLPVVMFLQLASKDQICRALPMTGKMATAMNPIFAM